MSDEVGSGAFQPQPGVVDGRPPGRGQPLEPDLKPAYRLGQRQELRKATSVERVAIWVLGLAWPFVVALLGIALTALGIDFTSPDPASEQATFLLILCCFMGSPVVVAWVHCWLPTSWPGPHRFLVALLLAAPCVLVVVFVALVVFGEVINSG